MWQKTVTFFGLILSIINALRIHGGCALAKKHFVRILGSPLTNKIWALSSRELIGVKEMYF